MNRDLLILVEGSLLERLLQRALEKGAVFFRIERTGPRSMHFTADERSADILTALCKKYGLKCRVLHRGGFAALGDMLRHRWTLLPGMVLCILICTLFLSRIWIIDISFAGSSSGNPADIAVCLQEAGVHPGIPVSAVDTDILQKQLAAYASEYSFIGVKRQGIRLLVEAAPEIPAPPTYEIAQSRDLFASRSGVIEEITVYSGDACVKPGDTVLVGDLLIRGEEAKSKDETTPVRALGKVTARCWHEGWAEGKLETTTFTRTGENRTECRLRMPGFSLPVTQCENYASEETEEQVLPLVGLYLPLEMERTIHWETEKKCMPVDEMLLTSRLKTLALADIQKQLSEEGTQYEPAACWFDAEKNNNALRIRAVYEIYTDIAVSRDALD